MNKESVPELQSVPRVLLVGVHPGMGGMHMPRHLVRTGIEVAVIGASACMASRSGHVREYFPWNSDNKGFAVEPFTSCVRKFQPQWVVPLDELSVQILQQIGSGKQDGQGAGIPVDIVELVQHSLGDPKGYSLSSVRRRTYETACAAGIPVPTQADVGSLDATLAFAHSHGYPVVLKRENSMGGMGVFILEDEIALRNFFAQGLLASGGAAWVVQRYIPGKLGMHAVLAEKGRILAKVSAVQITRRSTKLTAPSSVVQLCRHESMAASCAAFVAATGASGFHAWDFQLEKAGGAFMIEHNPRPISISHLGGLLGDDLCTALAAACGGAPNRRPSDPAQECLVTLFPDEWLRDPQSPMLHGPFNDAPWDDPALFTALIKENVRFT